MLAPAEAPTEADFRAWVREAGLAGAGVRLFRGRGDGTMATWRETLGFLGGTLRALRGSEDGRGERLSPRNPDAGAFGWSAPRQASALRLCPVATADRGVLPVLLYTDNACGERSLLDVVERMPGLEPLN